MLDIKEICNRPRIALVTQQEVLEVVKRYIEIRKGRYIDINILKGSQFLGAFAKHKYLYDQLTKLNKAFIVASCWMVENNRYE